MIKYIKTYIFLIVVMVVSVVLQNIITDSQSLVLIKDEFLIGFIGVILGLGITIITFIYSSLDRISNFIKSTCEQENAEKIFDYLKKSFAELVSNNKYIFYMFALLICIILFEYIDIPYITFSHKPNVILTLKIFIFITIGIATVDNFKALFGLLKLVDYEKLPSNKNKR